MKKNTLNKFNIFILASHYAGTDAIVAGWGVREEQEGKITCMMREVEIPILSNLDCTHSTEYGAGMITENMICAGFMDGKNDSCQVRIFSHLLNKV